MTSSNEALTPREESLALEEPFTGVDLAWLDWGPADAERVVVCVHGLTRNARDFDALAQALAARGARVLTVDVAGRGRSSWLDDPLAYAVPTYAGQLGQWLRRLGVSGADWIGTSMGGLIGMALVASPEPPMARLVLNDIGPFVGKEALGQIKSYLALDLSFETLAAVEAHLRFIHAPFGRLSDAQWRHLATHSVRADGATFRLHYDPKIATPFEELANEDIDLWALWDTIRCPTLVLHGAESVILTAATCAEMRERGPKAEVVSFAEVGHAPALMADDQILAVMRWLGL